MHINWIKLQGVGPFKEDRHIPFQKGLNVLIGENEAGKSTVLRSIEALYFGFKPVKDWKYANWDATDVTLEGEIQETDEIASYVTRRYGARIRGSVQRGHLAEALGNGPFLETRIDLELYKSMFSMSTDELSNIGKKSWKELNDSLTDNYNSTVFKTAHEVVTELEAKSATLFKESGRGHSEMKRQREEEKELTEALAQLQIEHAYAVKSEDERRQLRSELAHVEGQLTQLDQKLLSQERFQKERVRQEEEAALTPEFQGLALLALPERAALDAHLLNKERLLQLKNQKQQLLAEQVKLEAELADLEKGPGLQHKGRSLVHIVLALLVVLGTGGALYAFWPNGLSYTELQWLGGLIGLSILAIVNIRVSAHLKWKKALLACGEQKLACQATYQGNRKALIALEADIEEATNQSLSVFEWLETHEDLSLDEALTYRMRLDYLAQRLEALKAQRLETETATDAGAADGNQTLEGLLQSKNEWTEKKIALERQLSHQTNMTAKEIEFKINDIEKRLGLANQKLWETALERDRMVFVSKIVAAAEQSYRHSQRPDFLLKASRYMKALTAGRYDEILMTEAGGFVLKSGNQMIPVGDSTSRGTREQMYLAIKTALMSRLDPMGTLPLLLDETAINFDARRRVGFYKMLEEIAQERQVIMTTCHEWFVAELHQHLELQIEALDEGMAQVAEGLKGKEVLG